MVKKCASFLLFSIHSFFTNQYIVETDVAFQHSGPMFKLNDGNFSSSDRNDTLQFVVLSQHLADFFDDLAEIETLGTERKRGTHS